jgi:hypothetical protein
MARRGRFGRSETGASNLSATIASLVRQQKQEEEKLLLEAYYSQIPYEGGEVPTLQDIIDFYNNTASMSGVSESSPEYQAYFQKINDITNYDIKRTYNQLIADFNQGKGENYEELVSFLADRATTSTDQQDLDSYAAGLDDATNAFIRFKGESLKRGEITARDYQAITLNALQSLEPGSDAYTSAIYDAMQYEWSSESDKWSKRVTAGTATASQFAAWSERFGKRVLNSGISKNSDLFLTISATTANQTGGGAGASSKKKLGKISNNLNAIFTEASATLQIDTGAQDYTDIAGLSDSDILKKMTKHPEVFASLWEFMDDNPGYTSPALERLGIETGDDGRVWLDKQLKVGFYEAQISGEDEDEWYAVNTTNGSLSTLDDFAVASTKWVKDKTAASGNEVLLAYYNNQWKDYLNGVKSIYGVAPKAWATESQLSYFNAERNAANGNVTGEVRTLSGLNNEQVDLDWANFPDTETRSLAVQNGQAVLVWDPAERTFTYDGVQAKAAGLKDGSYQYVTFAKVGGKVIGYTVSVRGVSIEDANGTVQAYRYELPSGKVLVVNTEGKVIQSPNIERSGEGFVVGKDGLGAVGDYAPNNDITPLLTNKNMPFDANDPEARRALIQTGQQIEEPTYDPDVLDQAAAVFEVASGALDDGSLSNGGGVGAINSVANEIRAKEIELSAAAETVEGKAQIATLRGNTQVAEGWNWVLQNQDKVQLVNGVPQLKPEYANQPPVSPRVSSPAEKLGIAALGPLGTVANAFSFLSQPNIGLDLVAAQEKIMTPEQKALRTTQVAATPQAQQYQATGYPSGLNTFFRNIGADQPQASRPMTGLSTYLGMQATVTPVIPPAPRPTMPPAPTPRITPVKTFTPLEIQQSLVDFRAGERNMK